MSADKSRHEDKFGEMLKGALRSHTEPVRDGFADDVLKSVRTVQEQKILSKVVLQERLALAGCIVLVILSIITIPVFSQAAEMSIAGLHNLRSIIIKSAPAIKSQWQLWIVFASAIGYAAYNILDMFLADR